MAQHPPNYGDNGERPLSDLLSDAMDKMQRLLQREVELAKIEIQQQTSRAVKGAGLLAGTALVGLLAVLLLSLAAAWGLAEVLPTAVAFLAVGLVYLVVAAALAAGGRKKLAELRPVPEETMRTIKQDVQVAKDSISVGASGGVPDIGSRLGTSYDTDMRRS